MSEAIQAALDALSGRIRSDRWIAATIETVLERFTDAKEADLADNLWHLLQDLRVAEREG